MSLKQQLVEDMKAAMKSGDKHTLGVVRLINAEDSAVPAAVAAELEHIAAVIDAIAARMAQLIESSVSKMPM